jgi:hypothetical protein
MLISVINYSNIPDEEVQAGIRAINRQIANDFAPYWGFGGQLRLEGGIGRVPDQQNLSELRGEAMIYLYDDLNVSNAFGSHGKNFRGVPFGFVFTALCAQLNEPWSITLSHEALELLGDPQGNLLAQGPHPGHPQQTVFHWFEMCDAVQSEWYLIDGIPVSNFVLPAYFTNGDEPGTRNDFLGRRDGYGNSLHSFGIKPGSYIGYFDPQINGMATWSVYGDSLANDRIAAKQASGAGRAKLLRR